MVAISAFFAVLSGVAMMLGRKYVVNGYVDVHATRRACRLALVSRVSAIILGVLAGFDLMMVAGTSSYAGQSVVGPIVVFMLLPVVLIAVTGALFFVARFVAAAFRCGPAPA